MKRSEMKLILSKVYLDSDRGIRTLLSGDEIELILKTIEEAGMLPPAGYLSENEWEPEDEQE